jgi:ABC-type branched-subunit amino acid transport system ATPase component
LTLACIAGASRPTRGRVRCFGYMSVLDTVTVGALLRKPHPCAARAHAREILALTGLAERAALRFELLDALDRKRLELARALATEPQLLLLDDLAAGLETPAVAALGGIFTALRGRGTTVVAATRTLEHLPLIADDVVAIDRGKTAK